MLNIDAADMTTLAGAALTSGRMEVMSLTATYGFTVQELQAATFGSRPVKTWLHEHVHAYQGMTTSYGYYTTMLRLYQNTRVVRIIREIGSASARLEPPLLDQIRRLKGPARARAQENAQAWYTVELLLMYLEGDLDRYSRLVTSSSDGRSFAALFAEVEENMIAYFKADLHNISPTTTSPLLREDRMLDEQILSWKFLAGDGGGDVRSVLESGALATEWWRAWPSTFEELKSSMPSITLYSRWIHHALRVLDAPDPQSLLLTYSALVDLALNPPILPHHADLRAPGMLSGEMNPFWRLITSMQMVSSAGVPIIRDLDRDYIRFNQSLCDLLGWPTPMAIAAASSERLPHALHMPDPMTANYSLASFLRGQDPVVFLDMDVWWDSSEPAKAFCGKFTHPVVQLAGDGAFFSAIPQDSITYVEQFLLHRYFNQIMASRTRPLPPIELPFNAIQGEVDIYTSKMEQTIRRRTGLMHPQVRLAAGAAPAHMD